jgi:hypothetical protein
MLNTETLYILKAIASQAIALLCLMSSAIAHHLMCRWTLWFDNPSTKQSLTRYGQGLRPVYSFDSVEDFWWCAKVSVASLSHCTCGQLVCGICQLHVLLPSAAVRKYSIAQHRTGYYRSGRLAVAADMPGLYQTSLQDHFKPACRKYWGRVARDDASPCCLTTCLLLPLHASAACDCCQ